MYQIVKGAVVAAAVLACAGLGGSAWAEEQTEKPPVTVAAADPVDDGETPAAEEEEAVAAVTPEVPSAKVIARVDLSEQRMYVYVENQLTYTWPVSTGRRGYGTPTGRWNAAWLSPRHRSRKYNNAPMPWSVFFHAGYAIHGTTEVRRLGSVASHGCVRLLTDNARTFYQLVVDYGKESTLISVVR